MGNGALPGLGAELLKRTHRYLSTSADTT